MKCSLSGGSAAGRGQRCARNRPSTLAARERVSAALRAARATAERLHALPLLGAIERVTRQARIRTVEEHAEVRASSTCCACCHRLGLLDGAAAVGPVRR